MKIRDDLTAVGCGRASARSVGLLLLLATLNCSTLFASRLACGIEQLSHSNVALLATEAVALNRPGNQVLLLSRDNPTGHNGDRNFELFWRDLESGEVAQLTNTRGGSLFGNGISASHNLDRVAFVTNRNPTGENPSARRQLFLLDTQAGEFRQITHFSNNALSLSPAPKISGNGRFIVFVSQENPSNDAVPVSPDDGTAGGNSPQVFLYDIKEGAFLQATQLSQLSTPVAFSVSRNGSLLAVLVTHRLGGFSEIDLIDLESGDLNLIVPLDQVYGDAGANDLIFLSEDGKRLFFVASTDLIGLNPDGSADVFSVSLDEAETAIDTVTQITRLAAGGGLEALTVSHDGTRVLIRTRSDLADWQGNNASNVFAIDNTSGEVLQVTHLDQPSRGSGRIFTNLDGSRILFSSADDPIGLNPDGSSEAFFTHCQAAQEGYFPQIGFGLAGGLRFVTSFIFVNPAESTSLFVQFFDRSGEPLTVDLGEYGVRSTFNFQIQRGTPLFLDTAARQALKVGYARVYGGPALNGNAVFTGSMHATDTILFEAAVPLAEPLSEFTLVVTNQNNYKTGLAMVNTAARGLPAVAFIPSDGGDATVHLRLYDRLFRPVAEKSIQLAPGQHQDLFVADFFENPQNRSVVRNLRGVLTVSSTQPLAVIALRQNDDPNEAFPKKIPTLTTYPVARGRPERDR